MEEIWNFLTSNTVLALIVSVLIFVVTLVLIVKRLIGFFITLLLLFFAIISGYAILNHDIVRAFLLKYYIDRSAETAPPSDGAAPTVPPEHHFQEQLKEAYDQLKTEFESYKEAFQEWQSKREMNSPHDQQDSHNDQKN